MGTLARVAAAVVSAVGNRSSKDAEVLSERKRAIVEAQLTAAQSTIAALRGALRKYGKHKVECYLALGCLCGLDAALFDGALGERSGG